MTGPSGARWVLGERGAACSSQLRSSPSEVWSTTGGNLLAGLPRILNTKRESPACLIPVISVRFIFNPVGVGSRRRPWFKSVHVSAHAAERILSSFAGKMQRPYHPHGARSGSEGPPVGQEIWRKIRKPCVSRPQGGLLFRPLAGRGAGVFRRVLRRQGLIDVLQQGGQPRLLHAQLVHLVHQVSQVVVAGAPLPHSGEN